MDTSKASAILYFDNRRAKKADRYPVKIRVYYDAQKNYYKTGIDLAESEWEAVTDSKSIRDDRLRTYKRKLNQKLEKANEILDKLKKFSFAAFKEEYYDKKVKAKDSRLEILFDSYIAALESNDQIGTAISYKSTKNSIEKFCPKQAIGQVTKDFLLDYEKWLRSRGLSPSTAGIYLRQLRALFNYAITLGYATKDKYPFTGFTIPTARNIKKALNSEQLRLIWNYETNDEFIRKALDFWIFSYLANGMNVADICLLKSKNVETDFLSFVREKTKRTKKKDLRPIKVMLTERATIIIEKWKNRTSNNPYLFPILSEGLTARQVKYKIQDFIGFINKNMKTVAADLGINVQVGTYVARHSHSTMLKRKGVPTELIKENLGHSSIATTELYLNDFADEVKLEYAKMLTDF